MRRSEKKIITKALKEKALLFLAVVSLMMSAGTVLTACENSTGQISENAPDDAEDNAEEQGEPGMLPEETGALSIETAEEVSYETEETEDIKVTDETEETAEEDPIIIVLDPGHDSEFCTRDQPQLGVNEQDLNLKIGLACRDRLNKYKGIKVYMTREDGSCPDAEDNGDLCIEKRTGIAAELDADLFVSLHNNATTGSLGASYDGAQVYISNYSKYTEESRKLGELILDKLSELDIRPDGVKIRTKEEKGHYDDGSVQDWYYLISYSVEGGHPGIIIEHAFMDNIHDNEILKDDENLEKMGTADADAIAEYYGLELKKTP